MTDRFQVYRLDPDDIVDQVGALGRLTPQLFPAGGGMKRFVTDPDLGFRAGHTKILKGRSFDTYFWYDEFWVIRHGSGRVVATDRATGEQTTVDLAPSDTVFLAKGIHIRAEGTSDEPWVFFYVAIPASKKDGPWLAYMTADDIADVRKREEYT